MFFDERAAEILKVLCFDKLSFSQLYNRLSMSRKTLAEKLRLLVSLKLVELCEGREKHFRGRPRVYYCATGEGIEISRLCERFRVRFMLHRLRSVEGLKFVFGLPFSLDAYGAPIYWATPLIVCFEKPGEEFRGFVFDEWRDQEVYRNACAGFSQGEEIPVFSLEDLVLYLFLKRREGRLVALIPAILALNLDELNVRYFLRRILKYDLVQEMGFLLEVADHLRPSKKLRDLLNELREKRTTVRKMILDMKRFKGKFYREKVDRGIHDIYSSIKAYEMYWNVTGSPNLEEFEEQFLNVAPKELRKDLLTRSSLIFSRLSKR